MPPRAGSLRRSGARVARPSGQIVVVTAADTSALDFLLTAVRRRMPSTSLEFPKRITTRRNGLPDAEIWVNRSIFRDIDRDQRFIVTWQADGHSFGLPSNIETIVEQGATAVVVAPAHVVPQLRDAFPSLRVINLADRLEAVRASLSPTARLQRIVGPKIAQRLEGRAGGAISAPVLHNGDFPSAVRVLTEALMEIERGLLQPVNCRSSQIPKRSKPTLRRSSALPAAL